MATFIRVTLLVLACAALPAPLAQSALLVEEAARLKASLAHTFQDRNFFSLLLRKTF